MTYKICAIDIENGDTASVCAVHGQVVYENPSAADIAQEKAKTIADEIVHSNITDEEIEENWTLLS